MGDNRGSRTNKVRDNLRALGLARVEVWVPEADVARVKALEAECAGPILAAAREKGLIGPAPLTEEQKLAIAELARSGSYPGVEIARMFGVHPSTVARLRQTAKRRNP